jgi:hypothetical protein
MKRLVIFGALFLAACATVAMTVDKAPEQTNQVRDTNYTLGVERTVVVGNPIVRVGIIWRQSPRPRPWKPLNHSS